MTEAANKPRGILGLALITFLLGPPSAMLWLGRWKPAILYVCVYFVWGVLIFVPAMFGLMPPVVVPGLDISVYPIIFGLPVSIVGFLHALQLRKSAFERPWFSRWYFALPSVLILSWGIAFTIRTFFYQPFNIPAASNIPTLMVGDYVFVSKTAYSSEHPPQRGDMAVFKLPTNEDIDYVKRVIGLPGDRIQMRDGVLYINGTAVKKERIMDFSDPTGEGGGRPVPQYIETLPNGVQYRVLDVEISGAGDNTMEYAVPPGHYFVLGDNRDNSQDSRYLEQVGYVPEENFIGPVVLLFWNSRGISLADRPEEVHPLQ